MLPGEVPNPINQFSSSWKTMLNSPIPFAVGMRAEQVALAMDDHPRIYDLPLLILTEDWGSILGPETAIAEYEGEITAVAEHKGFVALDQTVGLLKTNLQWNRNYASTVLHLLEEQFGKYIEMFTYDAEMTGFKIGETVGSAIDEAIEMEKALGVNLEIALEEETVHFSASEYLWRSEIFTHELPFRYLITELTRNALRNNDYSAGLVEVAAENTADFWHFSISNFGEPIAEEMLAAIQLPFVRERGPNDGVAGIGLTMAAMIMQECGGEMEITSGYVVGNQGMTTVRLKFPKHINS